VSELAASAPALTQKGANLVVVSFGSLVGGRRWRNEAGCGLPVYVDTDRVLYRAFGLHRSIHKVWQVSIIHYYAGQKASGRKLPGAVSGEEADPLQMGGDFTIRVSDGAVVMAHPSKTPNDRPSVQKVLDALV